MTAIIVTSGKIRTLQLLTADITHIGFGRPDPGWADEFAPPSETVGQTGLVDTIGYAKVSARGWLEETVGGDIIIDDVAYDKVAGPTTIGYVEAILPSGEAEGSANKIGQIGVFGEDVVTDPVGADWALDADISNPGTLIRIQHVPVYIKLPNTKLTYLVALPLLS